MEIISGSRQARSEVKMATSDMELDCRYVGFFTSAKHFIRCSSSAAAQDQIHCIFSEQSAKGLVQTFLPWKLSSVFNLRNVVHMQ